MDPMTMQAMAGAAGGIAQGIGAAVGGPNVSGADSRARFDNSGWSVATSRGNVRASDNRNETTGGDPDPWGWIKWAALAVVGVAAIRIIAAKV